MVNNNNKLGKCLNGKVKLLVLSLTLKVMEK